MPSVYELGLNARMILRGQKNRLVAIELMIFKEERKKGTNMKEAKIAWDKNKTVWSGVRGKSQNRK